MKKKQMCMILAAVVSVCFLVCLASTAMVLVSVARSGAELPLGMVMVTLVTALCAVMVWRGVREME